MEFSTGCDETSLEFSHIDMVFEHKMFVSPITVYLFGLYESVNTENLFIAFPKGEKKIFSLCETCKKARCQLLKWPTLCDRRTYLSLVECYEIVFGCYLLKLEDFFSNLLQLSLREPTIRINFMSNLPD